MFKTRVKEAIEAIRNGEIIIVMDDENRENEGDLVLAGEFSTPEKINFLAKEARGLICASISKDLSIKFDLPYMVKNNNSNHETAFTISIDARQAKTGISAFERDMTIKLLCDDSSCKDDFVRPGHIFPLIAKDGGVLERTGHTEASIDLCRLANVKEVAVICELMKDDGSMPGNGDKFISDFAKHHNLKVLFVADLVQYRLLHENLVSLIKRQDATFLGSDCKKYIFKDYGGNFHTVFKFGDPSVPLIRFHSIKSDLDLMEDYKLYSELVNAIKLVKTGGYLVYLSGSDLLPNMSSSTREVNSVHKSFGIGAQMLNLLGVKSFRLISNNMSTFVALKAFDLDLIERVSVDSNLSL